MESFADAFSRLRHNFDQAHRDREHLMQQTRFSVREHAAQTRRRIGEDEHNRRAEFVTAMRATRAGLRDHAAQTRRKIAEDARNRHAAFTTLIEETRSVLHDNAQRTRSELARLAKDLRDGGKNFRRKSA